MVRATDHPPDISVWHDGGNSPTTKALIIHGAIDDAGALLVAEALTSTAETIVMPEAKARDSLARIVPDVIVVDEHLDTMSGREFLADTATSHPLAVRILLEHPSDGAGHPDTDGIAVVAKPVNRNALRVLCRIAIDAAAWRSRALALEAENRSLRLVETHPTIGSLDDLDEVERYEGILTRSPRMRAVIAMLRAIEGSDVTTLIHGETGTGKELIARAIHARSRRRRGPFVAVNLGAMSDQLRESDLFGHVRGAFTGAVENRSGLFVEACGGCLFLDEVGDASPSLQVALLRVLEESTITPVGADRPRRVDVRIIAATNRSLEDLVQRRRFRADLFYRLNVFPIELPPLRERPEDILPLAQDFLDQAARRVGRNIEGISRDGRRALEGHRWDGNVRELRNLIERAVLLRKSGLIVAADLALAVPSPNRCQPLRPTIDIPTEGATLAEIEREVFRKTLVLTAGNKTRAARLLGIHEATFRFRLRKLGVDRSVQLP